MLVTDEEIRSLIHSQHPLDWELAYIILKGRGYIPFFVREIESYMLRVAQDKITQRFSCEVRSDKEAFLKSKGIEFTSYIRLSFRELGNKHLFIEARKQDKDFLCSRPIRDSLLSLCLFWQS